MCQGVKVCQGSPEHCTVNQLNLQNLQRTRTGSRRCLLIFGSPQRSLVRVTPFWLFGCLSHVKNVLETFFEFIVAVFTIIITFASIYRTEKPQISKMAAFFGGQKIPKRPLSSLTSLWYLSPTWIFRFPLNFVSSRVRVPARFTALAVRS